MIKNIKYKNLNVGFIYFLVHFIVEVSCFYTLSMYSKSNIFFFIALFYDFLAFVPQIIIGKLSDKYRNIDFGLIGVILTIISLVFLKFNLNYILIFIFLTIGNALIHVSGAEATLRISNGKMLPSSLFVSGGAIGVILGRILCNNKVSILYIIGLNIISIILILIARKYKKNEKLVLDDYNYANKKIDPKLIIILATIVVAVRSFMSYGIPTTWNTTVLDAVLLFSALTLGKALGGFLIDTIGIVKTSLISTIVALPFIIFGDTLIYVSLIGIMCFSMTMAITLALIVSVCKDSPGVGFGFTTIGLFLGTLPVFFFTMDNMVTNLIIFTILTIICIIILIKISHKERKV